MSHYNKKLYYQDWGCLDYKTAWDKQESYLKTSSQLKLENRNKNIDDIPHEISNYLFFVEHPPVITIGRNGLEKNNLIPQQQLESMGISYVHSNRGGDITVHSPGQLVVYPIIDLEQFKPDLGWYVRSLEEVIILTLKEFGIEGKRSVGETGVWLDPEKLGLSRKICAIGVRSSRWITMHGLAFNISNDLNFFNFIIPCGIPDKKVSSLKIELNQDININFVKLIVLRNFEKIFQSQIIQIHDN